MFSIMTSFWSSSVRSLVLFGDFPISR